MKRPVVAVIAAGLLALILALLWLPGRDGSGASGETTGATPASAARPVALASALAAGVVSDFVVANRRIRFDKLKPGHHVFCGIALPGSPDDPEVMAAMGGDTVNQRIYCAETTLAETPAEQEAAITVQPSR